MLPMRLWRSTECWLDNGFVTVIGVRESGDGVEIHIVARWGRPLPDIAEQVRRVVRPLVGPVDVLVVIDDIELRPVRPAPLVLAG